MRINHNVSSMITQGALSSGVQSLSKSLERLSTGLRINRASDDAAGLSVSEQLRTQVRGAGVARRNASDGIALLQIAEGAAGEIASMLQRMRELAVQSTNDTLTTTERTYTNQEYQALMSEVNRVSDSTQYNTQTLLAGGTGSFGGTNSASSVLHIGPNSGTNAKITIAISGTSTGALKIANGGVTTQARAETAILSLDVAITSINKLRSDLGSYVNRLEHAINNLDTMSHNSQSAESSIRDADFAVESTNYSRNSIMVQSATAMLAQSNSTPQSVLALLQ